LFNVLKATGGEEALRLARQNDKIHLLLTSFSIHEPDTLELTQQFQRAHPGAPILLVLGAFEVFDERFNTLGRNRNDGETIRAERALMHPGQDAAVTCAEPHDLARFEGEGGLAAPETAAAHPLESNIINTKLEARKAAASISEPADNHLNSRAPKL
jgi:CheY-like chemotaxis protein